MNKNKKIKELEKELFHKKYGIVDTSNLLLDLGVYEYEVFIKYIFKFQPRRLIQIADASLKYHIKKRFGNNQFNRFNALIKRGKILQAPSGTRSDIFIIQLAILNSNHFIISNDAFSDYDKQWTTSLNLIKMISLNSQFYFNIKLNKAKKKTDDSQKPKKKGLDLLFDPTLQDQPENITEIWKDNLYG